MDTILEKVSKFVHEEMWVKWAIILLDEEKFSKKRVKRWNKLFVEYEELSERQKNVDRMFARKIVAILKGVKNGSTGK